MVKLSTIAAPVASSTLLLRLIMLLSSVDDVLVVPAATHGMYVWTDEFDAEAPHCNGVYPPDDDGDNASCFVHSWETPVARSHLWASSTIVGREVTRIFLSDVRQRTRYGPNGGLNSVGVCDVDLMTTLSEAHLYGIEVYGLFASSDAAFSEQNMVGGLNDFNAECGTATAYFDGASVNNEYFTSVKSCGVGNEAAQLQFLDDLQTTADNAFPLPLHFSVSWNWNCCTCSSSSYVRRELLWNGATKSALEHMIDIADSVDVQVAWNTGSTMTSRSQRPYDYWEMNKMGVTTTTAFYVLAYTNPNSDCRLSFAPHTKGALTATDTCSTGDRTEEGMLTAFGVVQSTHTNADGGIHFMGGVYSTGMPGWPKHDAVPFTPNPTNGPTPETTPEPTQEPTPEPTSTPTPPVASVEKYICKKNAPADTEICSTGILFPDGTCSSAGAGCGNGGKVCHLATCPGGSEPTPPTPTPPPPTPPTTCPVCGDGSECCLEVGTCETSGKPSSRRCVSR